MQLEIGQIVNGKVTGITKFGAFIDLGEGKTGMVHISEVAATFVKDINDYLKMGQDVKVKVISISDDGKIALSIKKTIENERQQEKYNPQFKRGARIPRSPTPPYQTPARPGNFEWQNKPNSSDDFEAMMLKFKQTSEEKISDLKKNTEAKRGGGSRRGDNNR
jgi:S1 RNA binding domain protein